MDNNTILLQERGAKPGTIAAYGQGLLHGVKYIAAEKSISTDTVQTYLRQVISHSQKEAEMVRGKTWQDFSQKRKWLHWEEVIEVVKQQRDAYNSKIAPNERAQESHDYAVLLLYTAIPPARAQEYRTLQLCKRDHCNVQHSTSSNPMNIIHISEDGSTGKLEISQYKNSAYCGRQTIDISYADYLLEHLVDYIEKDRPVLLQGKPDHHFLFMVRQKVVSFCCVYTPHACLYFVQDKVGHPFSASRWTLHIQHIFAKHSGSSIGPSHLRSSFVTYLLDGEVSADDSLARDVASAMRHSVRYVSSFLFHFVSMLLMNSRIYNIPFISFTAKTCL